MRLALLALSVATMAVFAAVPAIASADHRLAFKIGAKTQDIGGWQPHVDSSLSAALAHFGDQYDALYAWGGYGEGCTVRYNRLGLTLIFLNLGYKEEGLDACDLGQTTHLDIARVSGKNARAHWATTRGVRVGDSLKKTRAAYPRGKRTRGWLTISENRNRFRWFGLQLAKTGHVKAIAADLSYGGE